MLQRVQVHASWAVVMGVHRWCCGRAWAHSLCCCGTAVGQGLGVVKCTPLGLLAPAPSAAAVRERAGAQLRPRRQRGPSQEAGVVTVGELPFTATESLPFFFFFNQIPPVKACHSKPPPSLSHSPTFQPVQRLSRSGCVTTQLFSLLQVSPGSQISLVMTQPGSTVSVGTHGPCTFVTSSLFPPATSSFQVHAGAVLTSMFGRGGSH